MNRNFTKKTNFICFNQHDDQFQSHMLRFYYFFCEKVEMAREEEVTKSKLREHINDKSMNKNVNPQLILFTKTYVASSFS